MEKKVERVEIRKKGFRGERGAREEIGENEKKQWNIMETLKE